ncbi:MAG: chorismate synthase [Planctomycetes bacterium]|nr:chorismate synthase [Planctomycetota bacterium]
MTFTVKTAGESHGGGVYAQVEGLPLGLTLDTAYIDRLLRDRQGGHGRGGRMKVEQDAVTVLAGVRNGATIGGPLLLAVTNRDARIDQTGEMTRPRPGHVDLAGALKFGLTDARPITERGSARETAARVAAGGVAKLLLREFGVEVSGHVLAIGGVRAVEAARGAREILAARAASPVYCCDAEASARMVAEIDLARDEGDTLGGVVEVVCENAPPGLGSHAQWNARLDARLAAAVMSIPAFKGVEIGLGFGAAARRGSRAHDAIGVGGDRRARPSGFTRGSNHAGGIEGGITNGEPVIARGAMKPIATLQRPLDSVDLRSRAPAAAAVERSDVCAVPAAAVVAEAMVAIVIAGAFLEKFAGDSLAQARGSFERFMSDLGAR